MQGATSTHVPKVRCKNIANGRLTPATAVPLVKAQHGKEAAMAGSNFALVKIHGMYAIACYAVAIAYCDLKIESKSELRNQPN
jgi:hypothetical protein